LANQRGQGVSGGEPLIESALEIVGVIAGESENPCPLFLQAILLQAPDQNRRGNRGHQKNDSGDKA
jgi:hypothetical protein